MNKKLLSTTMFILFLLSCIAGSFSYAVSSGRIAVNIDTDPDSISFKDNRGRITCMATLPETGRGLTIDAKSVTLGDKIVADSVTTYQDIAIIKFKRSDLLNFIREEGHKIPSTLNLSLKGNFTEGESFVGNTTIKLTSSPKLYTYLRPDKYSRGKLIIK